MHSSLYSILPCRAAPAMDSYAALLEKTRVPQPTLQRHAVISLFSKLRSAPNYLDLDSKPGREAISQCLHSISPPVVDQSVRELCRLVLDSKLDLSRGFLELQSTLEGCDPKFVGLFVKGIGFFIRLGFERNCGSFLSGPTENHPFVRVLSSRTDVKSELIGQVLACLGQNRGVRMVEVCEFLRPFLNFSILCIPFSDFSSILFVKELYSSMASFCCSFPNDAMPVLKLMMGCLKHLPHKNSDELKNSYYILECLVDAYTVVLRHLVGTGSLVTEAQLFGLEISVTILSLLLTCHHGHAGGCEQIVELVKRLFVVQKDLSLRFLPELSSILLSLFSVLIQSELEHDQLSLLKLLNFLLKWKSENEYEVYGAKYALSEEVLFTFPVINLISSTSRSIKGEAAEILVMLEKLLAQLLKAPKIKVAAEEGSPAISSPGSIAYRLLQHLWFQDQYSLFASFVNASSGKTDGKGMHNNLTPWPSRLREHVLTIVDRKKSSLAISQSQERFISEMPLLLSAITGVLVIHRSLGDTAIDLLAAIGIVDPKQGVPLLLAILFYSNIFTRKDTNYQHMLPKLLGMLPSLASQSVMIPLIIQTILPMLQKDGKPVLYATGARLLCQTWAINDRAFGSLQAILLPKGFTEFNSERNICISLAASIRDVCRINPDRGVDLILSVSVCIESEDHIIKALGFQSLAHLCEADVIDFYTAWDVIGKHAVGYTTDPVLAESVCLLLRWGATDAEAYSEASRNVIQILWDIAHLNPSLEWTKARTSAFEALSQYEVAHMEKAIPDFKRENKDLLLSETNFDVLRAMEGFQVKIITHEHKTRRRLVKEKKVAASKIEKLLNVIPQVLFPSGRKGSAGQLPGAALLCLSFTPKDVNNQSLSRVFREVHTGYENALVEIAASLQLSRNIFIALLSLQSWKSFTRRWMRANISSLDAKTPIASDRTSKAATDILKSMMRLAEESIPSSAENIALAVGALCLVLPPSAHTIKSTGSKFLLSWLFQDEHEHRQWSAAISLGLISSCLHVTDHQQKFQNSTGLIKVLHNSKSFLVKGACAVGLGFACQDLITRVEADNGDLEEKENYKAMEIDLLGKILRSLLLMTSQLSQASYDILDSLSPYFPIGTNDMETNMTSELLLEKCDDLKEDTWGVAGLVLGLGSSFGALYRVGAHDAMLKIKDLIISWIPHVDSLLANSAFSRKGMEKVLSVGSCLALPTVVAFCQRLEMINDNDLDLMLNGYRELITELVSVKKTGTFHQSLMLASCVGAGSLIACILKEGTHPVEAEFVKDLLEMFRKCYSSPYPSIIHLGGLLGVVNAMGAGAGILVHGHHFSASVKTVYEQKESSQISGPLFSSPLCEPHLTTLLQEIFLVAQNSDDIQMQQNAAWAVSFLRNGLSSKEFLNAENNDLTDVADSKTVSHSFPEDNLVMKLSTWLMHLNNHRAGTIAPVEMVVTVLRCLSQAPRLPTMDWGLIVRRCMRYEAQASELLSPDSTLKKGALREECIRFSIAHANHFNPLLTFLDELCDLPRFRTLELNLQWCLLFHLDLVIKIFSGSRLQKLFDDIAEYFCSDPLYQRYGRDQKSSLRISCWKGLRWCLDEAVLSSVEYISNVEKCMEVLFHLLPISESATIKGVDLSNSAEEWCEAGQCLGKAQRDWLLNFLQVSLGDLVQGDGRSSEILKKILAKAKLVGMGSILLTELGKLKAHMLNCKSKGTWNVLVEVVAALQHAEGGVKRQWLVDAVEISCVSSYPSTALQFLGLLSGSCCKYSSLLTMDQSSVLSDLPVTLPSLLMEPSWEVVAELVVANLWTSTERIRNWIANNAALHATPSTQLIDESENDIASFLLQVMHRTCVSLKEYLPLEKQLRLANMLIS